MHTTAKQRPISIYIGSPWEWMHLGSNDRQYYLPDYDIQEIGHVLLAITNCIKQTKSPNNRPSILAVYTYKLRLQVVLLF